MIDYLLYIKKCPGITDPNDFKIGIAGLDNARSRLASYQNTVGPVYQEQFDRVFLGQRVHVKEAESQIKYHFRDRIWSSEAGFSEWLCNTSQEEILNFIKELQTEYFIRIQECPQQFLPLTMDGCADLANWVRQPQT